VRLVNGQEEHLAPTDAMQVARYRDGSFALEDLDQRVVRGGVLTQLLTGVEGEERDVAGSRRPPS
jgi:hypothetical protein